MSIKDGFKFGLGLWLATILVGTVWILLILFWGSLLIRLVTG